MSTVPQKFADKKVLVWDSYFGHAVEHAVRLAKDFGKVWYYTPCFGAMFKEAVLGRGMEGVERVTAFFDYVDKADLIVFLDVGAGDMAVHLRNKGHRVFSAGAAEELEQDRFLMRQKQKEIGLPTQKTVRVVGTSKLQEYLAKHKDKVVKLNVFRGNMETLKADELFHVDQEIHKMKADFGPWKDTFPFIVESQVDGVEIGIDGFFAEKWLMPVTWGLLNEDSYLGKYTWNPPAVLAGINQKLQFLLKERGCRGFVSTEARCPTGTKGYLIDMTCRFPIPLSLIFTESLKNYSEVVWQVAGGEEAVPEPVSRYVGYTFFKSPWLVENWETLQVKDRSRVKMGRVTRCDNHYYSVPGEENGFTVIGLGNTPRQVIDSIKETSGGIACHELSIDAGIGTLEATLEKITELTSIGIFFNGSDNEGR